MNSNHMPDKKIILYLCAISTIFVLIGLAEMPYGYYQLLRFILCGSALYTVVACFNSENPFILFGFGGLAILYNPIIPVHLGDKEIWIVLNFLTLGGFWFLYIFKSILESKEKTNDYREELETGINSGTNSYQDTSKNLNELDLKDTDDIENYYFNGEEEPDDIEEQSERYHNQIDDQVESLYDFMCENHEEPKNEFDLKTIAVFATHVSALIAVDRHFSGTHRSCINTLVRTLAFRTPNTQTDYEREPGVFVSRCGIEESFMHRQTETFEQEGEFPLIQRLIALLKGNQKDCEKLSQQIEFASEQAKETYIPHLVSI